MKWPYLIVFFLVLNPMSLFAEEYPLGTPVSESDPLSNEEYPIGKPFYRLENPSSGVIFKGEVTNSDNEVYPDGVEPNVLEFPVNFYEPRTDVENYPIGMDISNTPSRPFEEYPVFSNLDSQNAWAQALQSCSEYGQRQARAYARSQRKSRYCGYCAVGTRHAIMCAMKRLNMPLTKDLHCGPGAYSYHSTCFEEFVLKTI